MYGIEFGVDYTDGDVIERRDRTPVGGRGGREVRVGV